MTLSNINPVEIQSNQGGKEKGRAAVPASSFGDILGGVSAMGPFATEFTRQASGNINAATVLNAAFTSFPAAAGSFAGGAAPSWAMASSAIPYQLGPGSGMPNLGANYPTYPQNMAGGSQVVPGTNLSQFQLMEIMNQNNLKLIELQALMQSNMQVWNTKSNILSADHRAKMAMIEKFSARG